MSAPAENHGDGGGRKKQQGQSNTTGEAQRRRIIEMLRTGPKTTLDFRMGV